MPVTIAVAALKGGAGKTTTTLNLAGVFAERGQRVLVIDCDSQGDTSALLIRDHESLQLTVAALFGEAPPMLDDIWQISEVAGMDDVHVIPSDRRLEFTDSGCEFRQDSRLTILRDELDHWRDSFDVVLIDTPPRMSLAGFAALAAADIALVPVEPSLMSFRAIASLRAELTAGDSPLFPSLAMRFFLNRRKRSRFCDECIEALTATVPAAEILPPLADSAAISGATSRGLPITTASRRSAAANAYRELADSLTSLETQHAHARAA